MHLRYVTKADLPIFFVILQPKWDQFRQKLMLVREQRHQQNLSLCTKPLHYSAYMDLKRDFSSKLEVRNDPVYLKEITVTGTTLEDFFIPVLKNEVPAEDLG